MELDQEVRAYFTSDEQVEAKRLQIYVSSKGERDSWYWLSNSARACKQQSSSPMICIEKFPEVQSRQMLFHVSS